MANTAAPSTMPAPRVGASRVAHAGAVLQRSMCIVRGHRLPPVVGAFGRRIASHWVDADDGDAEVTQPVEEPMQLGLVGEGAGERALAAARVELEMLERVGEGST